ncbi:MAG: urea ABC transporter permease subunit UrtB [Desulfobacterales bacterium]|jgi:urea transport system permease protein|nr:MAG: urea ABC transporter permease subunit UrtB [Desulfobacterales bacterium]
MDEITIIQFVNAISYSMILILGAIGLSIIFGLMGVINMAHGELFMLGAYTAVIAQKLGMNLWIGILFSPIFVGIVGLALEVSIIRRFYTRPFVTLVATWGISIIFRQLIKMLFGPGHQIIRNPLAGSLDLFGIAYPKYRLLIMLITGIILIFLFVFFHKTPFGLKCRAIIQNRDMSTALGINVGDIDRWTFSIGAALAGMAGAIMTPLITINPEMGLPFLSQSFLVVILGGVGSLFGLIGGAVLVSCCRFFLSFFFRLTTAQIFVFLMAIILIRIRPQGLFGKKIA